MRSSYVLRASSAALAAVSSWVTPTRTSRPSSILPTTSSPTVTAARLTVCTSARITDSLGHAAASAAGPYPRGGHAQRRDLVGRHGGLFPAHRDGVVEQADRIAGGLAQEEVEQLAGAGAHRVLD